MALGALVSRITGFIRNAMIVAALGTALLSDAYTVANTLPNTIFMLLMGGTLTSVLVPELVRARHDADGGVACCDRFLTACLIVLALATAGVICAAPALIHAYAPAFTGQQLDLSVSLARYCLPQLFFYGLFTLLGQILVSRDRFGPMAWTPVLNNLVAIAVFATFIAVTHRAHAADHISSNSAALLGLGSTLGIAVQALALWPSLRRSGHTWRPRFDWRGQGLTRIVRSAGWAGASLTVGQLAFWAITRMATGLSQDAARQHLAAGVGLSAYLSAYQLWIVPHGIVAVSLTTAALPRLTRSVVQHDRGAFAELVTDLTQSLAAVLVPVALVMGVMAPQIAALAYRYGRTTADDCMIIAEILAAFAPGLPAMSAQYAHARALQALGDNRTPALLTCVSSVLNVAGSTVAYMVLPTRWAAVGMAAAHTVACMTGAVVTSRLLSHRAQQPGAPAADAVPGLRLKNAFGPGHASTAVHLRTLAAGLPGAAVAGLLSYTVAPRGVGSPVFLIAVTGAGCLLVGCSLRILASPMHVPQSIGILVHSMQYLVQNARRLKTLTAPSGKAGFRRDRS
ncbi:murein biosynthesis integral membrane protein MurJ [Streptomyces luteireticuli]|uniref:murein biosynthesis integral membrane protein MurJ n=1 Tax=Streptomyces luteireticuli TaxID=173858 RepID=UPI003558DB98